MPDIVIDIITEMATRQGYAQGADPTLKFPHVLEENEATEALPVMMEIDGRLDKHEELADGDDAAELATLTGMNKPLDVHIEGPIVAPPIRRLSVPIRSTDKPTNRQFPSTQFVEVFVGCNVSLPGPHRRYSSFAQSGR